MGDGITQLSRTEGYLIVLDLAMFPGKELGYAWFSCISETTMLDELLVFLAMLAAFFVSSFLFHFNASLGLMLGAIVGALVAGEGIPVRHLLEGMFTYLDTIMIIATAVIFMKFVQQSGALDTLNAYAIKKFNKRPVILLFILMGVMMFPGMVVGSSTAAVVSSGAIIYPLLLAIGLPKIETAAFIAMGAILGTTAPPVNIKVMSIAQAMDIPYIGFDVILLLLTIPTAMFCSLYFGYKHVKNFNYESIEKDLDFETGRKHGFKVFIPLLILVLLIVGPKIFSSWFPSIGMSATFMLCALISIFTGNKFKVWDSAIDAIKSVLPVMGILVGVGMFIQIMTLTGVRGYIVNKCVSLPPSLIYLGIAVSVPAFGAISSLGSATVLGIPLTLTLAINGGNQIIVSSAIASIAGLGELVPPTALAGLFAARLVGIDNYLLVVKRCIAPSLIIIATGILCLIFAKPLASFLL